MMTAQATKWPLAEEVPNLTGKVALVTGANSAQGIGFHTAYQLVAKGAKVYVGARSPAKAESAIQEMRNENPSIPEDKLLPFVADLGDLQSVKTAAQSLLGTETRLDILVNNAGLLPRPLDINSDGISVSFATNHLGPFVLTAELMPLLKKTAETNPGVRVVMVSSSTSIFPPLGTRFDSLASFNAEMQPSAVGNAAFTRYALSKLANLLYARKLQKKFNTEGIDAIAISLHPGLIKTDGAIRMLGPEKQHMLQGTMTPMTGALNSLFAATNPIVWEKKGMFGGAHLIPHGKIDTPVGDAQNDELADELWATSERVVEEVLKRGEQS